MGSTFIGPGGVSGGDYPASALIRYADYVNGSDAYNGLSPSRAYKTIQAAYDALVVGAASGDGVGRIVTLPGDHEVGTGVVVDYRYPVEIEGFRHGRGYGTSAKASRIVSASAAATELILTGGLSNVTYGNRFVGLTFVVQPGNTALTACIRARANTHLNVERCFGVTSDATSRDIPLLEQHPGGSAQDNAWLRFTNSVASGLPLYHAESGTNFNRSLIGWNVCFFGSGASFPMVWLEGDFWQGLVIGNTLEGGASGPHITVGSAGDSADNNVFMANVGESGAGSTPYYHVVNGGFNQFIGGNCTGSGTGTWIQFDTAGYTNRVVNPWLRDRAGTSGYKRAVVDNSSYPALNVIIGRGGRIHWQKSSGSPTFSASDFVSAPGDGTVVGVTHNTGSGERRLWMYINGTYVSTVLA